jgi:hypothetical protein
MALHTSFVGSSAKCRSWTLKTSLVLSTPHLEEVEIQDRTPFYPSPGGVAQWVERVLYHSTRRAVPKRSWVQSLLPTTEVEPGFSTFGGMLVPVLQLISSVCKTGTSLLGSDPF